MKKLLILVLLLLSLPAYAQKSEWMEPSYNFTKARRIYVSYTVAPELRNGITEKESSDWFFSQIKKEVVEKIPPGYKVESQFKAEERILNETGESMESRITKSPEEAKTFFAIFLRDNYDLLLEAAFLENKTGKKMVFLGEEVPTTTVTLRFDVTDTATAKYVLSVLDQREKSDEMLERRISPKGMFNRITADFSSRFLKALQEETGKKVKQDVGF